MASQDRVAGIGMPAGTRMRSISPKGANGRGAVTKAIPVTRS